MGAATTFYSILRARGQKKVYNIENNKKFRRLKSRKLLRHTDFCVVFYIKYFLWRGLAGVSVFQCLNICSQHVCTSGIVGCFEQYQKSLAHWGAQHNVRETSGRKKGRGTYVLGNNRTDIQLFKWQSAQQRYIYTYKNR